MAKKAPKLLPCPFCGKEPRYFRSPTGQFHSIDCPTQGCVIAEVAEGDLKEAARRWNSRAPLASKERGE